jgi:hypothetical protein
MRTILLTFFIAVTSTCFSQTSNDDWIYVGASSDSINTFYVRKTYVAKQDNILKIWIKTTSQKYKWGRKTYDNNVMAKNLYVMDCSNQRLKIISTLLYDSKGKVLDSADKDEILVEWMNAAPETIAESIVNKACSLFF